jgi:hypothetical protein
MKKILFPLLLSLMLGINAAEDSVEYPFPVTTNTRFVSTIIKLKIYSEEGTYLETASAQHSWPEEKFFVWIPIFSIKHNQYAVTSEVICVKEIPNFGQYAITKPYEQRVTPNQGLSINCLLPAPHTLIVANKDTQNLEILKRFIDSPTLEITSCRILTQKEYEDK